MIYDSILGTIGKTPVVRVQRLAPAHVTLYVKCEFFNPMASVKDRLAIAIIEDAERTGTLKPGQTVVEATSGNTGIALAMVCAAKGYPFVAIMSETFSVERRKLMRILGAKVILTPAAERGTGMVRKAEELAKKHGWKIGDRLFLKGTVFPVDLELTIRGVFSAPQPTESLYFNSSYLEEAYPDIKGLAGFYGVLADSPDAVPRVAKEIDAEFRNSPRPTKTESERAFQLGWIAMLGNVKAFILSISLAVVFATLLVSANTIAMSIRERTREVAVLRTLGFTRIRLLRLFVSEAITLAMAGGILGALAASGLVTVMAHSPQVGMFLAGVKVTTPTLLAALATAAVVGLASAFLPAYNASRQNIVEGLRHIG